jgi:hypothetical protein
MKPLVARLALELRLPVSRVVHVLFCRTLSEELSIACVTSKSWTPVVKRIHMLNGGLVAAKLAVARLAFVVLVHIGTSVNRQTFEVQSDKEWWIDRFPSGGYSARGAARYKRGCLISQQATGAGPVYALYHRLHLPSPARRGPSRPLS